MNVLLFRHAETPWTVTGQHTGRSELDLTDAGVAQARAAGPLFERLLGGRALDVVYSSPRRRARRTLELALGVDVEPRVTDLLAEFDYGAYEGLTLAQIEQRAPGWNIWDDGCPEGETVEQVGERADRFIELLNTQGPEQSICAVSHGHMIRVLAARMVGLPASAGRIFAIDTASVADLTLKATSFVVTSWNLTV